MNTKDTYGTSIINHTKKYILYERSYIWNEDGIIWYKCASDNKDLLIMLGYVLTRCLQHSYLIVDNDGFKHEMDFRLKKGYLISPKPDKIYSSIIEPLDKELKKIESDIKRGERTLKWGYLDWNKKKWLSQHIYKQKQLLKQIPLQKYKQLCEQYSQELIH